MCVLITGGAAFVLSKAQQKQYTATAQVLFRNAQLDQQAAGLQVVNQTNPQPQTDTNLKLATLPRVAAETAAALDHGLTQEQVSNAVSVTPSGRHRPGASSGDLDVSDVCRADGECVCPERHSRTGSEQTRTTTRMRCEAVNLQFKALTPAQQNGVEGADLKDRANSLQILSQLQSGEVQLEQAAAAPTAPSSPKVMRNTVLGALLGLLIGLGAAFVLQRLDRRLREPSDLEDVYGVPLLGVVPGEPGAPTGRRIWPSTRTRCLRTKPRSSASSARTSDTSTSTAIFGSW